MKKLFTQILRIFIPHTCIHCKKASDTSLCLTCSEGISRVVTLYAKKDTVELFALAPYVNPIIRSLIYKFKKHPHKKLLSYFIKKDSKPFSFLVQEKNLYIIEIPPHKKTFILPKLRIIPLLTFILPNIKKIYLRRTRTTKKQGTLSVIERKKNQRHSLSLYYPPHLNPNVHIIIVDDVITTGSSIKEAYRIVRKTYPENPITIIGLSYSQKWNADTFIAKL